MQGLYLVTSEQYSKRSTLDIARQAIPSGIDILQMREKHKTFEELAKLGKELKDLCKKHNVVFIINDNPNLAKEVDADGVHLGQEDIAKHPIKQTRQLLKNKIIGLSTHSLEQVKQANKLDIDYLAYGPVFKTQTKEYHLGTNHIKEILQISEKPVFFIGGIKLNNLNQLTELGVKNIAMITAITNAQNIQETIKDIKSRL